MAIPTGVGPEHLLAANRPIEYTIRFQNTGTDTAFRVLLTDILPPNWMSIPSGPAMPPTIIPEIRGLDTLEVLFSRLPCLIVPSLRRDPRAFLLLVWTSSPTCPLAH